MGEMRTRSSTAFFFRFIRTYDAQQGGVSSRHTSRRALQYRTRSPAAQQTNFNTKTTLPPGRIGGQPVYL